MKDTDSIQKLIREAIVELSRQNRMNEQKKDDYPTLEQISSYVWQRGYDLASPKRKWEYHQQIRLLINRRKKYWLRSLNINIVAIRSGLRYDISGYRHVLDGECTDLIIAEEQYKAIRKKREGSAHAEYDHDMQIVHSGYRTRRTSFPVGHPKHIPQQTQSRPN